MPGCTPIPGGGCTITRRGETTTIRTISDLANWLTDHPATPTWEVDEVCYSIGVYYTAPPPYIAVDWQAEHGPVGIIRRGQVFTVETLH